MATKKPICIYDGEKKEIESSDTIPSDNIPLASTTSVGGIKIRVDGTDLYIRTDGADA